MNYYNPYFGYPYMRAPVTSGGFLSKIFKGGFNWSSLLSGTQKTLNIVNQTIPLVKQVSPMMRNAKTMFTVMNELKKVDTPTDSNQQSSSQNHTSTKVEEQPKQDSNRYNNDDGPTFFI